MAIEQRQNSKLGGVGNAGTNAPDPSRIKGYIMEAVTELKKTTWPSKQEAIRLTSVVIGVIFVLGIYMGVLDAVLSLLVNKFSLIK